MFGDILKEVSQYIGWITVIFGAVVAFSKGARKHIVSIIRKSSKTDDIENDVKNIKSDIALMKKSDDCFKETLQALLRNEITQIYYNSLPYKKLSFYEKENLNKLYDSYKANGGNSYVRNIVEDEMLKWEVVKQ